MTHLQRYWSKRVDRVVNLIKKTRHKRTPGEYHALRIEIKKIKALFQLLHHHNKRFKRKRNFAPFAKLFDKAGQIREIQVERKLLKRNRIQAASSYLDQLLKNENKLKQAFTARSLGKIASAVLAKRKPVADYIADVNKTFGEAYVTQRKHKVVKKLFEKIRTRELHKLRKRVKTLHYNITQVRYQIDAREEYHWLRFQYLLGKWHDCDLVIRHLKQFLKKSKHQKVNTHGIDSILLRYSKERAKFLNRVRQSARYIRSLT